MDEQSVSTVSDVRLLSECSNGGGGAIPQMMANPHSVSKSYANQLHAAIMQWYPSQAGKLTGMFLQNHDEEKVTKYLRRPNRLRTKIGTFARLLDTAATDKVVSVGSTVTH